MIILQHPAISKVLSLCLSPPGCKPATLSPVNLGGGMLLGRLQIGSMLVPGGWNQACLLPHCIPRAWEKVRRKHLFKSADLWQTKIQPFSVLQTFSCYIAHRTVHSEHPFLSPSWFPIYWESIHFTKTKWHRRLNWCCWFWKHFFPLNTVCCSFKRSAENESVVNRSFLKYWFWDYRFVFIFIQLNSAK